MLCMCDISAPLIALSLLTQRLTCIWGRAVQIIACLVAVRTYNLGASDFKNTEVFKEALESQSSDFGESFNEIEDAPSVVQE